MTCGRVWRESLKEHEKKKVDEGFMLRALWNDLIIGLINAWPWTAEGIYIVRPGLTYQAYRTFELNPSLIIRG